MKNIKQIALPLTLPLALALSSCAISNRSSYTSNSSPDSETPMSTRAVEYSLASSEREGMLEAYATFFKDTFECDKLHVTTRSSDGIIYDYSDESVSGTSSHYQFFESRPAGYCDTYYHAKTIEQWAFIDEDGRTISAETDESSSSRYFMDEATYEGTYERYKKDIDLPQYLDDALTIKGDGEPMTSPTFDNGVYKTFLSEPKDGVSDILLTVTIKDEKGNDFEAVRLEATAKDGLVERVAYTYSALVREIDGRLLSESFYCYENQYLFFTYPETVDIEIPDISGWEDMTDMKDSSK
ncbi:MAG: hypothetical protein J5627_03915 [Bacilli bacterium]|nr:hypothetical protein [Bacilli bacterium]